MLPTVTNLAHEGCCCCCCCCYYYYYYYDDDDCTLRMHLIYKNVKTSVGQ